MSGDEIAAVVGVEGVGDAADGPAGIGLAPDRVAEGERGAQGGDASVRIRGDPGSRRGAAGYGVFGRQVSSPNRFPAICIL